MSYKALYRRWRPKAFEDVIGQENITITLRNQIKYSNISHAYLFSGTRGTGKTSTAKIFARAVNCLSPEDFNPCNKCEVCEGILAENIMDVIEIDAASNNGVDHIREIRENVKYPPSKGKYKVYIVDEVHMLTTNAFNALLKTLEEPPNHVIFILATTEPHKIPATILSRCQRFDFKPVSTKNITQRLKNICEWMNIDYEEGALSIIAFCAEGALRDALSIMEQCISSNTSKITYDEVLKTLGIVRIGGIAQLVEFLLKKNTTKTLENIQQILSEGKDLHQFIKSLIDHLRNMIMVKVGVEAEALAGISDEAIQSLKKQSEKVDTDEIIRIIDILTETESKARYSSQPRIVIEMAMIKICNQSIDFSIAGLMQRIKKLEKEIATGQFLSTDLSNKNQIESLNKRNTNNLKQDFSANNENTLKKEEHKNTNAINFGEIKDKWRILLDTLRQQKKASIQAMLKEGKPLYIKENTLVIGFKEGYGFLRERLDSEKTKLYICKLLNEITGKNIGISFIVEDDLGGTASSEGEKIISKLKEVVPSEILEIIED